MSAVSKMIAEHVPAPPSSAESKKENAKLDDIVRELVNDPPTEKRKPGRPPSKTPKSPAREKPPPPGPAAPEPVMQRQITPEEVADRIANKSVIRGLASYCRRFPQHAPDQSYNPYLYSAAQNKLVIEAIIEAVESEIEYHTAPALITDGIRQAEDAAMFWAMVNTENPIASTVSNLYQVSEKIINDPAISLDIGLLECKIQNKLPKNPYLRIGINIARVVGKHVSGRALSTVTAKPAPEKYSEF